MGRRSEVAIHRQATGLQEEGMGCKNHVGISFLVKIQIDLKAECLTILMTVLMATQEVDF